MSVKAQPPPRKVKHSNQLKTVHGEQLSKLQLKHQQDTELLDDIRNFTKIRAQIEKDYGTAMVKLATTYLAKKPPPGVDYKSEDKADIKSVFGVWRLLLDESEKIGKARLASADVFQSRISENAKNTRQAKLAVARKCFDALRKYQEEVQQTVLEVDKTRKLYFEEEHMAHDARGKAHDVEEKLKKKKGGIFSSISSLQKKNDKFSSRREACDIQSTKARNDYLLALAAANAHQKRYYEIDLRDVLESLDCDISEKVREYLVLMSRTELLTVAACNSSFGRIQEEASKITKQYSIDQYLVENPVLGTTIEYEFDACDGDEIRMICTDHLAEHALQKDAKRWASAYMKECRVLRDSNRELHKLYARRDKGEKTIENVSGESEEIDAKIEEYKNIIRRAETGLMKAEARLAILRAGGVNVDEFLSTLDIDSLQIEELTRKGSTASRRSFDAREAEERPDSQSSSAADEGIRQRDSYEDDTQIAGGAAPTGVDGAGSVNNRNSSQSYDDYPEQQECAADESDYSGSRAGIRQDVSGSGGGGSQQGGFGDAITYDWGDEEPAPASADAAAQAAASGEPLSYDASAAGGGGAGYSTGTWHSGAGTDEAGDDVSDWASAAGQLTAGCRCVAIYSYEAANEDELAFVENEELECVHEGDGDGWIRARNSQGVEGYIPANYVQLQFQLPEGNGGAESFSAVSYESSTVAAAGATAAASGVAAISETADAAAGNATDDGLSNQATAEVGTDLAAAAAAAAATTTTASVVQPPSSLGGDLAPDSAGCGRVPYCRALYDYESTCEDELSFSEGDIIRIVSKLGSDDVDDGWWTGEFNGKVGTFPSLVVEEIKHTGEPQTPLTPMVQTPDGFPPPPNFEPPEPARTPGEEESCLPPGMPPAVPPPPPPPQALHKTDSEEASVPPPSGPPPVPPPPAPEPTSTVNIVIDSPDEPPREFFDSFDEDEPPTTIERKPVDPEKKQKTKTKEDTAAAAADDDNKETKAGESNADDHSHSKNGQNIDKDEQVVPPPSADSTEGSAPQNSAEQGGDGEKVDNVSTTNQSKHTVTENSTTSEDATSNDNNAKVDGSEPQAATTTTTTSSATALSSDNPVAPSNQTAATTADGADSVQDDLPAPPPPPPEEPTGLPEFPPSQDEVPMETGEDGPPLELPPPPPPAPEAVTSPTSADSEVDLC